MDISIYIPHGRKNAISRQALKDLTGCSDRENRAMIERARMNGTPILSSSACSGYWISDDPSEIDAFRREQANRAKKLMRMVSALDNKKAVRWPAPRKGSTAASGYSGSAPTTDQGFEGWPPKGSQSPLLLGWSF